MFRITRARVPNSRFPRTTALSRSQSVHTTDSYAKDIDTSPPPNSSIHVIDSASDAASKLHGKNNYKKTAYRSEAGGDSVLASGEKGQANPFENGKASGGKNLHIIEE